MSLIISSGILAFAAVPIALSDPVTSNQFTPAYALGPNGEVPLDGVSNDDVAEFARGTGLDMSEARFLLFAGSKAISDFVTKYKGSPDYGDLRVRRSSGLDIDIRITVASSPLPDRLRAAVGREVNVMVGGLSYEESMAQFDAAAGALERAASESGPLRATATTDFETGAAILRVHPSDAETLRRYAGSVPLVIDPDMELVQAASFAGNLLDPTCTVGYAARNASNLHSLVTAAHCPDTGTSSSGYALGNAQDEYCTNIDRQRHVTPANLVYSGFFNYNEQWTSINSTATGWFTGQPFFRRGKHTKALGTISSYTSVAVGGGDCGSYTVKGFNLYNSSGLGAVPGDSGGPLLLVYNGHYLIAGTLSGTAATVSQGFSAWISAPPGWTPCTVTTPCP